MSTAPLYSVVIPTFRRGEMLEACLQSLCALNYPGDRVEVVIVDNGGAENNQSVSRPFAGRLRLRHLVNRVNKGYGYSVNRGIVEAAGDRILLLNDDARPCPGLLGECERLLATDAAIGCVGCRADEAGYINGGEGIEHVYGFCYVFTRRAVDLAGLNDRTLLAQPYSSGNRIETDHCLMIRRAGLRVVYNPRMVALHLAKPRPDMSEVSLAWKRNAIRNTLYLYLKHYGPFGKRAAAMRLTFLRDVGILSALRQPSRANLVYFLSGLRARGSAYVHYLKYLTGGNGDRPEVLRAILARDEAAS